MRRVGPGRAAKAVRGTETTGRRESERAELTVWIVLLAILVLLLAGSVFLLRRRGRSGSVLNQAATGVEAGLVEERGQAEFSAASGDFSSPYRLPAEACGRVILPTGPGQQSYQFLSLLDDGRAVLLHRQSLILAKPARDGGETAATGRNQTVTYELERILAEAPYGVQAVADDRYVIWGIGGDEVRELFCFDAETDEMTGLASDENGFYGFALLPGHCFYTTRIDYDNMVKIPLVYLSFDLATGQRAEIPAEESRRDRRLDLLAERTGRELAGWTYEAGKSWSEAYLTGAGNLYELRIAYADLLADCYDYQLYEVALDGTELKIAEGKAAPRPRLTAATAWLSCDDSWYYGGRWYRAEGGGLPLYYELDRPYFILTE